MYPRVISHFFNVWHDSSLIVKRDLHKNESCHISIYQRVTPPFFLSQLAFELGCVTVMVSAVLGELCVWHEWVLSHIHESCHIWMSHVPFFFFCRSWHSSLALVLQWWVQCLKSCIIMCSRATFRCQVRQIRFKRDLYTWKETCKKRSAYSKSYGTKYSRATFQWQVRKIRFKRDLCTWKETYSKDPLIWRDTLTSPLVRILMARCYKYVKRDLYISKETYRRYWFQQNVMPRALRYDTREKRVISN